jgi:hypothetical protein
MADGSTHGGRRWVAMRVKQPHKEKLACRWLEIAGFETLLPEETLTGYRRRRGKRERVTLSRLALPGYVFLAVPPEAKPDQVIYEAREAVTVLGWPIGINKHDPLLLSEGWTSTLVLDREGLSEIGYCPVPGDKVQLNAVVGTLEGYRGMVDAVTGRQVLVIVQALHRALKVTVPLHAIFQLA